MSSSINKKTIRKKLSEHHNALSKFHLRDLFAQDKDRGKNFTSQFNDLYIDFSKNILTNETLDLLFEYAKSLNIKKSINAMFHGEKINVTEKRVALHFALRAKPGETLGLENSTVMKKIKDELQKIKEFVSLVNDKKLTGWTNKPLDTFVNIGIGGSDLGPKMVARALNQYCVNKTHSFFISNIDYEQIESLKKVINPETTLFIISSKSFNTIETITNANTLKSWMLESGCNEVGRHFAAVSSNIEAVEKFGIKKENTFKIWDWVGGRFSLWSAIGLPIALAIGFENFERILLGAHKMDEHFINQAPEENIPVILALIDYWYINFFGAETQAFIPYDESLKYFPTYLSQLFMESNGKSTNLSGNTVDYKTGAIAWGAIGTNSQHSINQLLHQGKHMIPIDFLAPLSKKGNQKHHELLLANCIAQSRALMQGESNAKPYQHIDGNKPSTTILYDALTPELLGSLLAMYEHRVFVQGLLLEINSFDQYGVELGKKVALNISKKLANKEKNTNIDSSTQNLIDIYIKLKENNSEN